jgi:hypothetical protein
MKYVILLVVALVPLLNGRRQRHRLHNRSAIGAASL